MSPTKEKSKKSPNKIQPTLFGIKNFHIKQKVTKRIGKNQLEVIGEFVRVKKGEGAIDCFPHQCSF